MQLQHEYPVRLILRLTELDPDPEACPNLVLFGIVTRFSDVEQF